jgi:hypothetical protein
MKLAKISLTVVWAIFASRDVRAQNLQTQAQLEDLKQSIAANTQALSQFTWQEQQTVLIKGNLKSQELFQVEPGPDGNPQKKPLKPQTSSSHKLGLPGRINQRKTEEFEHYEKQIAALAQSYAELEPVRLEQLFEKGSVLIGSGGTPNTIWAVIQDYEKRGDYVALTFDRTQRAIQTVEISSYLNDASDPVKISEQYAVLPNEPNHVSQMVVDEAMEQLTIQVYDFDYQRMAPLRWPERAYPRTSETYAVNRDR